MAELTEKQLILLNTLVYLDADYSSGKPMHVLMEELSKPGRLESMDIGGGMTLEEAQDLIKEIRADDELMALSVDASIDTEIRGVCFVNEKTDEAIIAFRGTGPNYAAWDDNCQGGYLADTDMQQEALAFAQDCAERYDNIIMTGHSKGGNLAQYCTILMGDEVERCVSFDGQGFGDEFLIKYAKEIVQNRDKIRSVCAYNDYVNVLLTPIAKEIVYLDTDETGMGGHYIYDLYKHPKNKLDNSGEYVSSRSQAIWLTLAKSELDKFILKLDIFSWNNPFAEFVVYSLAGILMGTFVSSEAKGWKENEQWEKMLEKILGEFLENLEDYIGIDFLDWFHKENGGVKISVSVDTTALRETGTIMQNAVSEIDGLYTQVQRIKNQMATNIIKGVAIGAPLQMVMKQLEKETNKLKKLAAFLQNSAQLYDDAEVANKGISQ